MRARAGPTVAGRGAGGIVDVAVVGAGPAGMAAACVAAERGASVMVIGDAPAPGGQIWRRSWDGTADPRSARWLARLENPAIELHAGVTVVDAERVGGAGAGQPEGFRLVVERDGATSDLRARQLVLATGARELLLPFPGWTLPGVTGVGGLQALVKNGFDVRGKRIVVSGSGPLLVAVAASLARRGATIVALVEQAPAARVARFMARLVTRPSVARDALGYAVSISPRSVRLGSWVSRVEGEDRVRSVTITNGVGTTTIDCDLVATGYGLVPSTELGRLLGCGIALGAIVVNSGQRTTVDGVFAAGECAGVAGADTAVIEGEIAGLAAAGAPAADSLRSRRDRLREWGGVLGSTFALRAEVGSLARPDTVICRCEDVTLAAIDPSWTSRQAKLYARVGMGACQGRVCGAAMRQLRDWETDRVRSPIIPSFVATLAADAATPTPGAR